MSGGQPPAEPSAAPVPDDRARRGGAREEDDEPRGYFIGGCGCECPIWPNGRIEWCECGR